MGLMSFERRVERLVEGTFARAFRSGLRPVELGRRLTREMDDDRTVDVRGRTVVPNHFLVHLASEDQANLSDITATLVRELADGAREHARDEGYTFLGPVEVELVTDPGLRTGAFQITARMKESAGGTGAGSLLLPTGDRVPLGEYIVSLGRNPDCTIVLSDPNASRRHAEVRPKGTGYAVVDLGSTNGTLVNGTKIDEHALIDGDELQIGSTHLRFEAS